MAKDLTGKLRDAFGRFNAQDLAGAERLCGEILARAPNHPEALHLRGVMRLMGGNAREAVSLLGKAVKSSPDDTAATGRLRWNGLPRNTSHGRSVSMHRVNPAMNECA